MNIGIVGLGYWGPNIVRNALAAKGINRVVACDIDQAQLDKISAKHPESRGGNQQQPGPASGRSRHRRRGRCPAGRSAPPHCPEGH
jgi:3-hydroxyacyl-CoA dehydrogenase